MKLPGISLKQKPLVVTVTLNPVLDRTLWVRDFRAGETYIADRSESFAGGKGVNVSRALLSFGVPSIATGIIPERGNDLYLELMKRDGIAQDFYFTDGFLRTNITIVSSRNEQETHLREKGPVISKPAFKNFVNKLNAVISGGSKQEGKNPALYENKPCRYSPPICILSGSIPSGLPREAYHDLICFLKERGALVFLDASGDALKKGLEAKPLFIKPNLREVEDALGFSPASPTTITRAFDAFHNMGIDQVMISRGKEGLLFSRGDGIISASITVDNPLNTVGSGDAALCGGVLGCILNLKDDETARLACALGAANTLIAGACRFSKKDVSDFYSRVTVERW